MAPAWMRSPKKACDRGKPPVVVRARSTHPPTRTPRRRATRNRRAPRAAPRSRGTRAHATSATNGLNCASGRDGHGETAGAARSP
jgi:hypothetical protein